MSDPATPPDATGRTLMGATLAIWCAALLAVHPHAWDVTPLKWGLTLVVACGTLLLPSARAALDRPLTGPLRWVGAALALTAIHAAIAPGPFTVAAEHAGRLALLMYVAALTRDLFWVQGERLLRLSVLAGLALAALGLLQRFGFDPLYGELSRHVAVATLGNSNALAIVLGAVLPIAAARALAGDKAALIATTLLGGALAVTGSRGGLLAGALGVAVVLALVVRRVPLKRCLLVLGTPVALGLLVIVAAPTSDEDDSRGLFEARRSNHVRLSVATASLDVVADAPWFGHGPGRFPVEFTRFRDAEEAEVPTRGGARSVVLDPHNVWLRLAAEGGWITALCLLVGAGGLAVHLARTPQAHREDDGTGRAALLGAVVALGAASWVWCLALDASTAVWMGILFGAGCASRDEIAHRAPRRLPSALAAAGLALWWLGSSTPGAVGEWRIASRVGGLDWSNGRPGPFSVAQLTSLLEDLDAAADADPHHAQRQALVGSLWLSAAPHGAPDVGPRLVRAERRFQAALRSHPRHVESLRSLAEISVRRHRPDQARPQLQRLARLEPWRGSASEQLAALEKRFGRPADAALRRLADGAPLEEGLAEAKRLRESGDARAAARLLDGITPGPQGRGEYHRQSGLAWEALGDDVRAAKHKRLAQLAYAIESLDLNELARAKRSLGFARRYGGEVNAGDREERLLDARIALATDQLATALESLQSLEPGSATDIESFVRDAALVLFDEPLLHSSLERAGLQRD